MTTVRQQRERLEELLKTFSTVIDEQTITLTLVPRHEDATEPIAEAELPAFFISRAGRAEHEKSDYGGDHFSSRLWLAWIVAAEKLPNNPESSREAEDLAEDLIEPLINFLFDHPRLDLNGTPLDIQGITVKDDGVKGYQRSGKDYSAVPILIYIGKNRSTG